MGLSKNVDLFFLPENQFAVMAAHALHRIAAIDRSAAFAELASLLLGSVGTEDDILRLDAERLQEAHPELVSRPDIQHLRNSDAHLRAVFRLETRRNASLRTKSATLGNAFFGPLDLRS